MADRESLLEARPQIEKAIPGEGELHICDLDNTEVALCGFRRGDRSVRLSFNPDHVATCAVCLDLYAGEMADA